MMFEQDRQRLEAEQEVARIMMFEQDRQRLKDEKEYYWTRIRGYEKKKRNER